MSKVKIKTKSGSIEMSDTLDKMVKMILQNLAPNVEKILSKELGDIMQNAQKNWLVRSSTNQFGTFVDKRTQDSKDDFELEVRAVSSAGRLAIKGAIRNNAPYAYAIKVGANSITGTGQKTSLASGTHLWGALVTKPVKKRAKEIQEKITNELAKIQKKG